MEEHSVHDFSEEEKSFLQNNLLEWYTNNKRAMPWRAVSDDKTIPLQDRAYSVLVSEVMLQQTQVSAVEEYYKKWMDKWPSLIHLSEATLEQVNEMWAGLGYYARGRRLLEFAKIIVKDYKGLIPSTTLELIKLPGIGKYTAGAIASIVFGEQVAAIDGNAIRVLTRLHAIGGCSDDTKINKIIWKKGQNLIPKRSGDFNQAIMDLANQVCKVKAPSCSSCPLNQHCKAFNGIQSIEDCSLCLPRELPSNITNYPRKNIKKPPRLEQLIVCVIKNDNKYLVVQRNDSGLLANFWEFPSFDNKHLKTKEHSSKLFRDYVHKQLKSKNICNIKVGYVGSVTHVFSHIKQIYIVFTGDGVNFDNISFKKCRWVTEFEFKKSAVSTGMKKVFKMVLLKVK